MEININKIYNTVRKFGLAENVGTGINDIWDAVLVDASLRQYNYIPYVNGNQPQGEDIFISSSDTDDTQIIRIIGLDSNGEWQEEDKQLAGQAKTQLQNQFFRIFRVYNLSNTPFQGLIYIYRNSIVTTGVPDDKSKIQAHILLGYEQTQMSQFTIPFNMRGWIKSYTLSISEYTVDTLLIFRPYIRNAGGVFRLQNTLGANTSGIGTVSRVYEDNQEDIDNHNFKLDSGTDIVWRSLSDTASNGASCEVIYKLARLK